MAKRRYTVSDVQAFLDDEEEEEDLRLEIFDCDSESDDGDREEADYISRNGIAELVPTDNYVGSSYAY